MKRSDTAVCPVCKREWPVTKAGYFMQHSIVGMGLLCRGSYQEVVKR